MSEPGLRKEQELEGENGESGTSGKSTCKGPVAASVLTVAGEQ